MRLLASQGGVGRCPCRGGAPEGAVQAKAPGASPQVRAAAGSFDDIFWKRDSSGLGFPPPRVTSFSLSFPVLVRPLMVGGVAYSGRDRVVHETSRVVYEGRPPSPGSTEIHRTDGPQSRQKPSMISEQPFLDRRSRPNMRQARPHRLRQAEKLAGRRRPKNAISSRSLAESDLQLNDHRHRSW